MALNVVFSTFWLFKKSTMGGPLIDMEPPSTPLIRPTSMLARFWLDISRLMLIMEAAVNRTVTVPMANLSSCESKDTRKYVPRIIPIIPDARAPGGNPITEAFYEDLGIEYRAVMIEELIKAAGAVGCLSGILEREKP